MGKINIADLLKGCQSGMELDCTMYENVYFDEICDDEDCPYPIRCYIIGDGVRNPFYLTKYGDFNTISNAKCVIFPKGKTTWEGFKRPFKNGDIVAFDSKYGTQIFIFKEYIYDHDYAQCYMMLNVNGDIDFESRGYFVQRFATKEEKEKLFKAIKDRGYRWNPETNTLENLIESKEDTDDGIVNDEIVMSGIYFDRENYADEVELHLNNYEIENRDGKTYAIFKNKETKKSKPKFNVGDRVKSKINQYEYTIVDIRKDVYIVYYATNKFGSHVYHVPFCDEDKFDLVTNKFDINTLVPFESRVLVRNANNKAWRPTIFGCYMKDKYEPFYVLGGTGWKQCIPYEGNEHLLGKTDDCNEFYKNL